MENSNLWSAREFIVFLTLAGYGGLFLHQVAQTSVIMTLDRKSSYIADKLFQVFSHHVVDMSIGLHIYLFYRVAVIHNCHLVR